MEMEKASEAISCPDAGYVEIGKGGAVDRACCRLATVTFNGIRTQPADIQMSICSTCTLINVT